MDFNVCWWLTKKWSEHGIEIIDVEIDEEHSKIPPLLPHMETWLNDHSFLKVYSDDKIRVSYKFWLVLSLYFFQTMGGKKPCLALHGSFLCSQEYLCSFKSWHALLYFPFLFFSQAIPQSFSSRLQTSITDITGILIFPASFTKIIHFNFCRYAWK